jgi:hypothetical protein
MRALTGVDRGLMEKGVIERGSAGKERKGGG